MINKYILFFLINRGIIWVSHLRIIRVLAEFLVPFDWQMTAIKYRNSIFVSMGRAIFCENIRPSLEYINVINHDVISIIKMINVFIT